MILTKVDDFFNWLFRDINNKFNWQALVVLLIGILLGIIISASTYGIILLISLKKQEKRHPSFVQDIDDEEVKETIKKIKKDYAELTVSFTPSEKVKVLGTTILDTVKSIASIYYPHSKYPLYELTLEELIVLCHYIAERIDQMFDRRILKPFKTMSISKVLKLLDTYKGIQETKVLKTVKKTTPVRKVLLTILNYANPIYWFKKLVINGTLSAATSKMSQIVIDIVADETMKVYSKSLFNEEKTLNDENITKELQEMEELQ